LRMISTHQRDVRGAVGGTGDLRPDSPERAGARRAFNPMGGTISAGVLRARLTAHDAWGLGPAA